MAQQSVREIEGFYDIQDEVLRDVFRSIYDSLTALQSRIEKIEEQITNIQDVAGED